MRPLDILSSYTVSVRPSESESDLISLGTFKNNLNKEFAGYYKTVTSDTFGGMNSGDDQLRLKEDGSVQFIYKSNFNEIKDKGSIIDCGTTDYCDNNNN